MKVAIGRRDALIVVDLQNDFCPGGALAVPDGDTIVSVVNRLVQKFDVAIATKDWHPADHSSFQEFGGQWPAHCLWNTIGAEFHQDVGAAFTERVFYKGFFREKDEYSGFGAFALRNDYGSYRFSPEQLRHAVIHDAVVSLADVLRASGIRHIFVVGLATDYCVKATALDGLELGFDVWVITDAIAAVNVNHGDGDRAVEEMVAAGAKLCTSRDILKTKRGKR